MHSRRDSSHRRRRRGAPAVGRKRAVAKVKKNRKSARVRRKSGGGLYGMDLLAHLFEIMDLFPIASEEAVGELAGRMMAERLRREAAERRFCLESGGGPAKTS